MNNFIFCSECGTKYARGTKFCGECGQSLASLTPTNRPAPAQAPVVVSKPATVLGARYGADDDSDPVDNLESIGHIQLNSLAVEITKDRTFVEKVGDVMLNPVDPKALPPPRPGVNYTIEDFKQEASALQTSSRQRGVNSTEIKG